MYFLEVLLFHINDVSLFINHYLKVEIDIPNTTIIARLIRLCHKAIGNSKKIEHGLKLLQ